ncbi:hypothetical protein J6590_023226 [Homalodisca vitripennis]|nr:hypothetical protein J6590_023226 [Homalodisca vitripennis]
MFVSDKSCERIKTCRDTCRLLPSGQPFHIFNKICVDLPRAHLSPEVLCRVEPYVIVDSSFHLPGGVDVLIDGPLMPSPLTQESHTLGSCVPHVIGTHFGFLLLGQASCLEQTQSTCNFKFPSLNS